MLRNLIGYGLRALSAINYAIGVRETDSNLVARLRMLYLTPYTVIVMAIIWTIKITFYLVAMAVVLGWDAVAEYFVGVAQLFSEICETIVDGWAEIKLVWNWKKPR